MERLGNWQFHRAAASIYNPDEDGVDYAYAGSASILHDPTGLGLTLSTGGRVLTSDNPYNLYGKIGYDTEFWAISPTGFGVDYTQGKDISGEGDEGTSYGVAAVQRIERSGSIYTPSSARTPSTTPPRRT